MKPILVFILGIAMACLPALPVRAADAPAPRRLLVVTVTLGISPLDGTPGHFPVAWCKMYGKGRVFYTSLGHREDLWDTDPAIKGRINPPEVAQKFQDFLTGGIEWAVGLQPGDAAPRGK